MDNWSHQLPASVQAELQHFEHLLHLVITHNVTINAFSVELWFWNHRRAFYDWFII